MRRVLPGLAAVLVSCRICPGQEQSFRDQPTAETAVFPIPCQGCCTQPWDMRPGKAEPCSELGSGIKNPAGSL